MKITKRNMCFVLLCPFVLLIFISSNALSNTVTRTSEVSAVVTQNNGGSYTYNYTVKNTSPAPQFKNDVEVWPLIVDFEIPINSPNDVWNVKSPAGWASEFISFSDYMTRFGEPNPFKSPYVLHWYTSLPLVFGPLVLSDESTVIPYKPIVPTGYNERFERYYYEPQTDGFMMDSLLSPVSGPYLTSWQDEFRNIGDPPLPGGNVGGGGTPSFNPVPGPASLILLITGLGGLICFRRLR